MKRLIRKNDVDGIFPFHRNAFLAYSLIIVFITSLTCCTNLDQPGKLKPVSLRCEYKIDPSGIDVKQPSFNWLFETTNQDLRRQKQTAYHILVASCSDSLSKGKGDQWDSGLVESDQSTNVIYSGKPLSSGVKYFWKVRVYDGMGNPSSWSKIATWDMGLLNGSDWQGSWIGSKKYLGRKPREIINGYSSIGASSQEEIKWVQLDLGKTTEFDKIVLHPALPMEFPGGYGTVVRNPGFGFPIRFRIDVSNDPDFNQYTTIVDKTEDDFSNPGHKQIVFSNYFTKSRYIRITATRLWNSNRGNRPFYFCLGELQIFDGDNIISLNKPVLAHDSSEGWGWSKNNLTDGLNLVGESELGHEAILLRYETELKKKIRTAKAYISGLGYYELYINGKKVGDHLLDPGFTDYSKRIHYVTYDVYEYLKNDRNAIGVILGGGWYNLATPDVWGFHSTEWTAPPKLLVNIVLEFIDGTKKIIASDESWKFSTGPIVFNCVRGGETYDARYERTGWTMTGYDDSGWEMAKIVPSPAGELVSQQHPPIRATKEITPISLSEPNPGVYVYDLGMNISGYSRFRVSGERGDSINLFYCESLNPDGTVRFGPHAWWHYGPYQTGKYIIKGNEWEVFEPRFTYHGFRYVEVTGVKNKPALEDLIGIRVHTDPDPVGEFSCSNHDINMVHELFVRTQLNNLHSIPTDCPHREKIGWMMDGLVTMEAAIYNFDLATLYIKWFRDMLDAQEANGHVPPIVPNSGWIHSTSSKNSEGVIPAFSDPWWGGALIMTPWNLYQYYGDKRYLEEGYDAMKAYLCWIGTKAEDYIFLANLGDWIEPAMFSDAEITPKDQIGTSAYFYFVHIMSKVAGLLNKHDDAENYTILAKNIREKYNKKFLDMETGFYAEHSQLAQVIPLLFDMVPQGKEKIVEQQLVNIIKEKYNNHLNTGMIGTPMLFKLLSKLGHAELAYTMATQEDHPGWFYMLRNGATTFWEVWDILAQTNHSQNHPPFGAIGAWYFQSLAGIQPDPEGPGFKKIIIKPEVVGDLKWAKASYNSIHGIIISEWKVEDNKFILNTAIPVNTTATVYIPANSLDSIFEGDKPSDQFNEIRYLKKERDKYVFKLGSGNYQFTSYLQ